MTLEGTLGWRRNNAATMLTSFLLTATFSFTYPFLPLYIQQIDGSTGQDAAMWAGISAGVQGLGAFIAGPLWGMAGDRWGRKPMLVRACLGGATGLLLLGLATSTWQIVAIRGFIGLMAGSAAAAMALVSAGTPDAQLPRALGRLQGTMLAGLALGPVIAIAFVSAVGYRSTFIIAGVLMFSGSIVAMLAIREPRDTLASSRAAKPPSLRSVLRVPLTWAALGLVLSLSFAGPMILPILSPYVATLLPEGANLNLTVGLLFFGFSAASAFAAVYAGRAIQAFGIQRMLLISTVGVAVFLLPMGLVSAVGALAVLVVLMSLFQGTLQTASVALLPTLVSATALSSMFGLYQSVQALSSQMGPALGGVIAAHIGFRAVFILAALALLLLGLPMFWVFRRVAARTQIADDIAEHDPHPLV
ncbi:MAG: MFS transporter [Candidatus Nanopelagicales bacterium]|nr:MFS transporter [Candidatus Nanopelagicales bacterium]